MSVEFALTKRTFPSCAEAVAARGSVNRLTASVLVEAVGMSEMKDRRLVEHILLLCLKFIFLRFDVWVEV
jgi:hypothetical protein